MVINIYAISISKQISFIPTIKPTLKKYIALTSLSFKAIEIVHYKFTNSGHVDIFSRAIQEALAGRLGILLGTQKYLS